MKTLVFNIKVNDEDRLTILDLQNEYSFSFRKLYKNFHLINDKEFIKSLKIRSVKQRDYLVKEVTKFKNINTQNKKRILENIQILESETKLPLKKFRHLQKLKNSYSKDVCFGDKTELNKLSRGVGDINKWRESRLLPIIFYGDKRRYGSRFFDIKEINEGKILFKLEGGGIKIPISFNPKKHIKELNLLKPLINNKLIPITISLTSKKIYITFDESILYNSNLDVKNFYKEISDIHNPNERKFLLKELAVSHDNFLKTGKMVRYLSIDLNPDGIGYSILNDEVKIIDKGFIDISKVKNIKKRTYETTIMVKKLFSLIKHYKCSYIIVEELSSLTPHKSKNVNKNVSGLWKRTLINEIINRRCNETKTIRIDVNPSYTSFIGNLLHNEYDPIAASIEVGRRGIKKFSKGGFFPEFNITNFINDKMYNKIKECKTWKELYSIFVTSKLSYRRGLGKFNFVGYNLQSRKSGVKHLKFL